MVSNDHTDKIYVAATERPANNIFSVTNQKLKNAFLAFDFLRLLGSNLILKRMRNIFQLPFKEEEVLLLSYH